MISLREFYHAFCYLQSILFLGRWRGLGGKGFEEFLVYRIAEGAMQQPSQENSA
jgi:hypothetical protein